MAERTKRIELPEGNWWELVANPRWKEIKAFRLAVIAAQAEGGSGDQIIDLYLETFTEAWSFPEEINADGIGERETAELIPVLTVVNQVLSPLLKALGVDDTPSA